MLHLDMTRISRSTERKLAAGTILEAEGKALVAAYEGGELVVKPSTGASGEVFAGISVSAIADLTVLPSVEEHAIEDGKFELDRDPIPGSLRVVVDGEVVAEGEEGYAIDGRVITVAGSKAVVSYQYSPSVLEAQSIQGNVEPGPHVASALGMTGVIEGGEVFTSEFDTTADWSGVPTVKLGANGQFTTAGNGTEVKCLVTHVPSAGRPFLGLSFQI